MTCMQPSISSWLTVESDEIDSPESNIISSKTIEGRSCPSYLPISYDGVIHRYFTDIVGHELGGQTTILRVSNICMQMGKFYAPGLATPINSARSIDTTASPTPMKSAMRFVEIKKPSFMVTPHLAAHNFYHFMIDSLPRFHFNERYSIFSSPVLISEFKEPFQNKIMKFLLRRNYPIYEMSYRVLIRDCAIAWPLNRTTSVDFLRKKSAWVPPDNTVKRIYISRRNTLFRQVRNEIELEPILYKYGFKIIECENMKFRDQISLFKSAEIVCGPHGAGLTNISFCQKNASVLEIIMEERLSVNVGSAFWELACAASLDYHVVSASRIPVDESNPHDGAMYVDPQKFEAALRHLIEHRK